LDKHPLQTAALLSQLLDASVEGILAFDLDCRYIAWNRAMERISGMQREDVLGKCAFDLFPFLKETGEDRCFHAALAGECSTSDNAPYTVPETGRQGFFQGFYSPLRDEQNQISGGIAVIHDVTERKRAREAAQEAHQRLTFHVENSPLAVIEWDSDFRVSRWSASAERVFGWKANEVIGKHVGDWHFVFDEDVDAVAQVTDRQRVGVELLGVQRNRNYTRDGSILYCEWYNSVLHDDAGKMESVLSLVLDVTARTLAEEERATLLARERDLRRQAEEADRLKDEFLATLSHELRTPLTSILGWATLIRGGDVDEANVSRAIEIIERNARSQARLIDDLLDVSRIITGNLQLDVHPLNLAPLVETANEALRPAADAKGIAVETELESEGCLVIGDSNRLRQVIWNLLINAIKFTPGGGKVGVRLECVDTGVRLTVSDTGEGITPEFLPFVFHRFRQEESSISRKAGGLGLGLAVARHLVELHGGNVSADSKGPGRGSTFIVELPLAHVRRDATGDGKSEKETPTSLSVGPKPSRLDGVRVLLVEDDDDSRNLLRLVLERQGAEVVAASSSAEALTVFDLGKVQSPASSLQSPASPLSLTREPSRFPDIIISDLGMPEQDGYELMRKIRSLLAGSSLTQNSTSGANNSLPIPAIALTGYATTKDRERALSAGYQLHLAKPVEPDDLIAAILALVSEPPA
jgi:PAS domain S-box-containing protein